MTIAICLHHCHDHGISHLLLNSMDIVPHCLKRDICNCWTVSVHTISPFKILFQLTMYKKNHPEDSQLSNISKEKKQGQKNPCCFLRVQKR
jgi:hypothetical protein